MTDYKYKLPVFEILEEGDLKFIRFLYINYIPQINQTLCTFVEDENGTPIKRIYYKVADVLYPIRHLDNEMLSIESEPIVLHVKLQICEDINNKFSFD